MKTVSCELSGEKSATTTVMSGEAFLIVMPCCCTSCGKLRLRDGHAVLHLHLRDVEIRADLRR